MVDESIREPAKARRAADAIEFVPKQEWDRAQQQIEKQQREIKRLQQEIEHLRKELDVALRAGKRQAAPHSRAENPRPIRSGRAVSQAGTTASIHAAPFRHAWMNCPDCGGGVRFDSREAQYQEEIVRRTVVRRFDIAVGHCCVCGRRVQGRHPLQTSDAVGVGGVQLGPEELTLAAVLNKQMGGCRSGTRDKCWPLGLGCKGVAPDSTERWHAWPTKRPPLMQGWSKQRGGL